jgi:hypothetical protein
VLLTAALGLLLISLTLPWLTINLFGQRSYSAFDNMQILTDAQKEEEEGNAGGTSFENNIKPQNDLVIADLTAVYPNSSSAFILSILILYPISIAVMVGAIVFSAIGKKGGSKTKLVLSSRIGLIAGILAIITAVLWIYSIQSFKDQFSRDADLSGGIIGEEWKGNANVIIDRLIVIGVGQYLVIASGVIAIFSHFIGNTYHKYENHPYHTTASEG